jgi:hypothetical protein
MRAWWLVSSLLFFYPRLKGRGSIEAAKQREYDEASGFSYPRLKGRGSIEANF